MGKIKYSERYYRNRKKKENEFIKNKIKALKREKQKLKDFKRNRE